MNMSNESQSHIREKERPRKGLKERTAKYSKRKETKPGE